MALYLPSPPLKLPLALLVPRLSSRTPPSSSLARRCPSVSHLPRRFPGHRRRGGLPVLASVGKEETDVRVSEEDQSDVSPEDLECVREIQRVLELLKKNRDMIFGEVNEGRIPKNRVALKLLAKEMTEWPNLEVESLEKGRPRKSLYAKATDTGVDPQAAKRLNIDWDSAVDIDPEDEDGDGDDIDVPPAVGYGALYLVTALPVIIAVSVVLILFYNSLQ